MRQDDHCSLPTSSTARPTSIHRKNPSFGDILYTEQTWEFANLRLGVAAAAQDVAAPWPVVVACCR